MTAHAKLSPSAAERWMNCPGSVRLTSHFPRTSNEYAAEGTVLHEIAADCLTDDREPEEFIGSVMSADGFTFKITRAHAAMIIPHLDHLRTLDGEMHVETRVDLGRWIPGGFGTLDLGFITSKVISIKDWKFGRNPVEAYRNRQMMIYAAGFWDNVGRHKSKATRFHLEIMQPNARAATTEYELELDELLDFMEEVRIAAKATQAADAPLKAGEHCGYCPLNPYIGGGGCRVLEAYILGAFGMTAKDLDRGSPKFPSLTDMTPERMVAIFKMRKMINKWLDSVESVLLKKALSGEKIGVRMGLGRDGHRRWDHPPLELEEIVGSVEDQLTAILGDEAYERALKTPTQLQELLAPSKSRTDPRWEKIQPLITRDPGKPKLVLEEDPAPPAPSLKDEFEDLD